MEYLRKYRTNHIWTDEERGIVRRDYSHTHASRRALASRLGVTDFAVAGQISIMGIAKRDDRRPWTEKEKETLRSLLPKYCVRKCAAMMHRSINSITVMSKRLNISRRQRAGWFTKHDICEILGVDYHWVQRRIDSGVIRASYHYGQRPTKLGGSAWHIEEADLVTYIRTYPEDLNARNLDIILIVDMLVGIKPLCPTQNKNNKSQLKEASK